MPIVDYALKAKQAKDCLLQRTDISENNFKYLREYLQAYQHSEARLALFCKHIGFILSKTFDIKGEMFDRSKINDIFNSFRKKLSQSYYETVVNVSIAFVTWLNDGERPKGFQDIKSRSKKLQKRKLMESDMIDWEDGLNMINFTNSIQFKAIIMAQLDGGFRPSEFIDINYGDVHKEGKFFIISVDGKTGPRDVILYKSAPYIYRWYNEHPTRQKNDPFWVMENNHKSRRCLSGTVRYDYYALKKRVRDIGAKASIKKPLDFYNFRHSACRLAKLENLPTELAAEKFGHSVEYFVNTYGRLSRKDKVNRHKKVYGESVNEETTIGSSGSKTTACSVCDTINPGGIDFCEKCGNPLTLKKALEAENRKDKEIAELRAKINSINSILMGLANEKSKSFQSS